MLKILFFVALICAPLFSAENSLYVSSRVVPGRQFDITIFLEDTPAVAAHLEKWKTACELPLQIGGMKIIDTSMPNQNTLRVTLLPTRTGTLFFIPAPLPFLQETMPLPTCTLTCSRKFAPALFSRYSYHLQPQLLEEQNMFPASEQSLGPIKTRLQEQRGVVFACMAFLVLFSSLAIFFFCVKGGLIVLPTREKKITPPNYEQVLQRIRDASSSPQEKLRNIFHLLQSMLTAQTGHDCFHCTATELLGLGLAPAQSPLHQFLISYDQFSFVPGAVPPQSFLLLGYAACEGIVGTETATNSKGF